MTRGSWEGADIADIFEGYIQFAILNNRERPGFEIAAMEAVRLDPEVGKHFAKIQKQVFGRLQTLLLERRDQIGHPNPDFASAYAIDVVTALLVGRLDADRRHMQLSQLSDQEFTAETIRLARSILQTEQTEK